MSGAISITAPRFTEEDRKLERENLTEQERQAIQNDLDGVTTFEETPEMKRDGPLHLMEVLDEIDGKECFLRALELCPELVEKESNPLYFLRYQRYDILEAAECMVKYWEFREWIFGERAFLPMTLTGHGALDEEDIAILRQGPTMLLNNDRKGRTVLYVGRTNVDTNADTDARRSFMRIQFYMLQQALEREPTQFKGIVVIFNAKDYELDRKLLRFPMYMGNGYFPIRVATIHFCTPAGKSLVRLVFPYILFALGKYCRQRLLYHSGTNSELIIDLYDAGGFKKEQIPQELGGSYNKLEELAKWIQRQRIKELREYPVINDDNEVAAVPTETAVTAGLEENKE